MNQDADIDLILRSCDDAFQRLAMLEQPCLITLQDETFGASDQYPGQVMAMAYALVRTSAFPDLKEQDPVSVKRFDELHSLTIALRILRIQDGRITQVFLGAV